MSELSEKLFSCYFFSPVLFQLTYREIFLNSWTSLTLATLSKSFLWFFCFSEIFLDPFQKTTFRVENVFLCLFVLNPKLLMSSLFPFLSRNFEQVATSVYFSLTPSHISLSLLASSLTLFLSLLSNTARECLSLCLSLSTSLSTFHESFSLSLS